MKIAMVSLDASPLAAPGGANAGGQLVHVVELSAALARRGHDVTVYTRRDDPDSPERVTTPQGYAVVHVPAGPSERLTKAQLLGCISSFAQYLHEQWGIHPPDVAHAHYWTSGVATQLAARAQSVPTVQTFHGLAEVKRRHQGADSSNLAARLKLEKLVATHATAVVATCTDEVSELVRMGRSRTEISVVPCGVDLETFSTEGPVAERGARHRIVAVGGLLPRKGLDTMIAALPAITDAEFVIVGSPDRSGLDADPEVLRLRKLAHRLGVADRITFVGALRRDDMPAMLRSADVVTCTPWYESFGIVALEAMASGVPVVAAAVGGMRDTIVHDVTGRLVTPGRPRECAEAVSPILRDSFLRRSLGLAGRDRACARYSWDRVAADTLRVYDRVVSPGIMNASSLTVLSEASTQFR